MASTTCSLSAVTVASAQQTRVASRQPCRASLQSAGMRRQGGVFSSPKSVDEKFAPVSRSARGPLRGKAGTVQALGAVEVAQIAGEAGYIGGTAAVMFAMTLVGLAVGFVLLRVESLVEEGEI